MVKIRYVQFPLDPIGGYLVMSGWNASWWGVGTIFTITWIVKYLVLRIGGRRMYEDYCMPFVFGYITGYALMVLMSSISYMVRYFMPY